MSDAALPPLLLELRAKVGEAITGLREVGAEARHVGASAEEGSTRSTSALSKIGGVGKAALFGVAGIAATVGTEAIHMGIDFQEATTQLVTGAGESEEQIGEVRKGILSLAGKVGQTPVDLAHGMYLIESAGYHGAQGLDVLKAAAEGAKVGGADMATVSDGVTTALKDYHLEASDAAEVTSKLVATVGAGKTNMGDLSQSIAKVLPPAASLKIGFNEVMGAMATMTGQGYHAAVAATSLNFLMSNLAVETGKGTTALKQIGLSAAQVHDSLGSKGLGATLQMITDAVGKKFPAGSAQYDSAIAAIVGGTRGMRAMLALTGKNAETFTKNTKDIGSAATETGGHVKGWSETQKDLGTQIDQAKASLEAILTTIGTGLIPIVDDAIKVVANIVGWFQQHTTVAKILAGVIGGMLATSIAVYIAGLIKAGAKSVIQFAKMVAAGAAWAVEHTAMAATFVAENIAMAASATAAFIAENAATLGIAAAIAAVVAGIVWLATHWKESWNAIKTAALAAWHFLDNDVLHPIEKAWHALGTAAMAAWHFIDHWFVQPWVSGFDTAKRLISGAIGKVEDVLKDLGRAFVWLWNHSIGWVFNKIEDGIRTVENAWDTMSNIGSGATSWLTGGSVHQGGTGTISGSLPSSGSFGHAHGGMVGDGFFMVGEQGPELGYKRGNNVTMFPSSQTPHATAGNQTIVVDLTALLDGQVVYRNQKQYALQDGFRNGRPYAANPAF